MSRNLRGLSARNGDVPTLFESLSKSAKTGSVSPAAIEALAKESNLPAAPLHGAASFYDFLRPDHHNKKAHLCTGTVCRMSQGLSESRAKLAQKYTAGEIGEMACVGRCYCAGGYEEQGKSFDVIKFLFGIC